MPIRKRFRRPLILWAVMGCFFVLHSYCHCNAIILLAKSKETFKLVELQLLEATIQSQAARCDVKRELVGRSTGSSLFRVDLSNTDDTSFPSTNLLSESWLSRCDWVGKVLVDGADAYDLLENMRTKSFSAVDWTLDYVQMRDSKMVATGQTPKQQYTMKSLLCAISHEMPTPPSLEPTKAKDRLLVLDTMTSGDHQSSFYLIQVIDKVVEDEASKDLSTIEGFSKQWAQRPFQYSSAINFSVGEIVVEILDTLCRKRADEHQKHVDFTLLDPTCGSGTFLALALRKGYHVIGSDYNERAVEGTLNNLEYMFSSDLVDERCNVELHDSSSFSEKDGNDDANISCVTANLPWGRNSVEYVDENSRILQTIRKRVGEGTPCAFMTRPSSVPSFDSQSASSSKLFEQAGFIVLDQAFVPQRDFSLPVGKMKPKGSDKDSASTPRKQQCLITIAIAGKC